MNMDNFLADFGNLIVNKLVLDSVPDEALKKEIERTLSIFNKHGVETTTLLKIIDELSK